MLEPAGPSPRVLLVDGRPVASLEVASSFGARARGLLGRTGIDGALLLPETASIHTFGMRFPIDVALCTDHLEVVAVQMVAPTRWVLPRRRIGAVIEAEAGSFARWGLVPGSVLAVRP